MSEAKQNFDPSGLQKAISDGHVTAQESLDSTVKYDLIEAIGEAMNEAYEEGEQPEEIEKAVVGYIAGRMNPDWQ